MSFTGLQDDRLPLIKMNKVVHIKGFAYMTDCGLPVPMQGRHLATMHQGELEEVTCKGCLATLEVKKQLII